MHKKRTVVYIQSNIITTGWDLVSKMCAGDQGGSCFYSRRTSKAYALRNRLAGGEILSHAFASLQRLFLLACIYTFSCSSNKLLFSHLDSHWGFISSEPTQLPTPTLSLESLLCLSPYSSVLRGTCRPHLLRKCILPWNPQHSYTFGASDVLTEWRGVAGVGWWEWSRILNRRMTYKKEH